MEVTVYCSRRWAMMNEDFYCPLMMTPRNLPVAMSVDDEGVEIEDIYVDQRNECLEMDQELGKDTEPEDNISQASEESVLDIETALKNLFSNNNDFGTNTEITSTRDTSTSQESKEFQDASAGTSQPKYTESSTMTDLSPERELDSPLTTTLYKRKTSSICFDVKDENDQVVTEAVSPIPLKRPRTSHQHHQVVGFNEVHEIEKYENKENTFFTKVDHVVPEMNHGIFKSSKKTCFDQLVPKGFVRNDENGKEYAHGGYEKGKENKLNYLLEPEYEYKSTPFLRLGLSRRSRINKPLHDLQKEFNNI